ncbi:hypothetical protein TSTA_039740 [Talaromyces stipitatus ATCC 10500]|uniref:Uncharacterized protein n=1 Tax=Talaromyces stipitatus (strain ATCC 10500 / CBS 375.48 / QM 6759 / NRRL 1006) TaxID=441959 RepID=B8M436_TALSN|nr:uncharacterized protein TSTA_039740 [Talaromyces stipitatus ATCC 10500]EED20779.1 hypothetical protein TSTA_039740 [Talaromyces stipitatus ATCC 10500]
MVLMSPPSIRTAIPLFILWQKKLGQVEAARFLVNKGADVAAVNAKGNTPLHEVMGGLLRDKRATRGPKYKTLRLADILRAQNEMITVIQDGSGYSNKLMDQPNAVECSVTPIGYQALAWQNSFCCLDFPTRICPLLDGNYVNAQFEGTAMREAPTRFEMYHIPSPRLYGAMPNMDPIALSTTMDGRSRDYRYMVRLVSLFEATAGAGKEIGQYE